MGTDRVRIYDLARELGVPSKVLITTLKDKLNIVVKSHSSTIDKDDIDKVKAILFEKKEPAKAKEEKKEQPITIEKEAPIFKKEAPIIKEETHTIEKEAPVAKEVTPTTQQEIKKTIQPTEEKIITTPKEEKPIQPPITQQPFRGTKPRREFPQPPAREQRPVQEGQKPKPGNSLHQTLKHQFQEKDDKTAASSSRPYQVSGDKYRRRPEGKVQQESRFKKPTAGSTGYQQNIATPEAATGTIPHIKQEFKLTKPLTSNEEAITQPQKAEAVLPKPEIKPVVEGFKKEEIKTERPKTIERPPLKRPEIPRKEGFVPERRPPLKEKPKKVTEIADEGEKRKTAKAPFKKEFPKKKTKFIAVKPLSEVFKKKAKPQKRIEIKEPEKPTEVTIIENITVGDLAEKLVISPTEIIKELIMMGIFATVNQTIEQEIAKTVAEKLEYTVHTEKTDEEKAEEIKEKEEKDEEEKVEKAKEKVKESKNKNFVSRAPIVTILGHVDHGKTTLLDSIRKAKHKIVDSEVGGITQSIGAYTVELNKNKKIVFIDTPGHHAFTAMRARGAEVTDIAILIVAADDGIMPQTIEAINHAKAAKVPIIVAINKIDKAGAEPDRILQQLTEHGLLPEAWGGDTVTVNISAIKGDNIDELLEMISLVAEIQELKADPTADATGVVIEAELDKGKGPLASVLIQNGTLKVGNRIVVGNVGGKVRALISDSGERLEEAGPSTPVEILGLSEVPQAGDKLTIVKDDKSLKQLVTQRKTEEKEKRFATSSPVKLQKDSIFKAKKKSSKNEEIRDLNIIIKADTDGSAQAVESVLLELQSKEITVKIIHKGVGDITEADVMLAATSNSIIVGFRVKEDPNINKLEETESVSIKTYEIIYQISEEIEKTMLGLLRPEFKEVELGTAEVRNLFTVGKNVVIAGCYVLEGKMVRNRKATVFRENKPIFTGNLDSLKRFKDDAKEVQSGFECGISFNKFNDLQEGDLIKLTDEIEIERDSLN